MQNTPQRPKFSFISPFSSKAPFLKAHQMTQNDLDLFKVNNANMHVTYTHEAPIFVHFALRWSVFELHALLGKLAPNDLKWPRHIGSQKYQYIYMHATYTPKDQIFARLSTVGRFRVTAQYWVKCTKWPQNKKVPMWIVPVGTFLRSKFLSVSLYDVQFWGNWDFLFPHCIKYKN